MMHAGVDESRPIIRDEKLVKSNAVWFLPRRDAVDAANYLVDACLSRAHCVFFESVSALVN